MQPSNPRFTPVEKVFLADVKRRALAGEPVSANEKASVLDIARKYAAPIPQETLRAAQRQGYSTAGIPVLQAA